MNTESDSHIRVTAIDMAWLGGIVDFKGRVVYKKNHTRATRQVTLGVDSKQYPVIRRMCQLTGTKPEQRSSRPLSEMFRRACVEHCPEAHVHVDREGLMMPGVWRWQVTGAAMATVLHNISHLLQVDCGYGALYDELIANVALMGRGSTEVANSLIRLRNLGWKLPESFAHGLASRHIIITPKLMSTPASPRGTVDATVVDQPET